MALHNVGQQTLLAHIPAHCASYVARRYPSEVLGRSGLVLKRFRDHQPTVVMAVDQWEAACYMLPIARLYRAVLPPWHGRPVKPTDVARARSVLQHSPVVWWCETLVT